MSEERESREVKRGEGWVEFGFIIFGLNGSKWVYNKTQLLLGLIGLMPIQPKQ